MLSSFAFKFNLHPYVEARFAVDSTDGYGAAGGCRLTVSKPVLKAPTVPALEATIW
jgi:hypothetical protein